MKTRLQHIVQNLKQAHSIINAQFLIVLVLIFGTGCGEMALDQLLQKDPTKTTLLIWDPSTLNEDASQLTDLAGYRVHYGSSPENYSESLDAGKATVFLVTDLLPGIYYFAVTAYDTSGNESTYSNEFAKIIN